MQYAGHTMYSLKISAAASTMNRLEMKHPLSRFSKPQKIEMNQKFNPEAPYACLPREKDNRNQDGEDLLVVIGEAREREREKEKKGPEKLKPPLSETFEVE
ncbi:hypothetical protein BPOR_1441g00010 [Botrytis porri]|uniref:Uncharacterized protein n=1 Tax=Botrytis porri TaxID=87229 RepID=A0A4Z1KHQ9_9HELO|nr:hypothetical protein BPOR_1441g00010 [Botrytis porri]